MDVVSAVSAISALAGQSIQLVDAVTTFVKQVKTARTEINTLLQSCSAASVDLKQFSENLQLELKLKLCIDAFYAELNVTITSCEETFQRLEVTLERAAPGIIKQQPDQGTSFQRKFDALTWPFKRKDLLAIQHSLNTIREDLSKKTGILVYTHMVNSEKVAIIKAKQKDRKGKKTQKVLEEYWQSKRKTFLLREKMSKIQHSTKATLSDEVTSASDQQPFSDIVSDSDSPKTGKQPKDHKSGTTPVAAAGPVPSSKASAPQKNQQVPSAQVDKAVNGKQAQVDSDDGVEEGPAIKEPSSIAVADGGVKGSPAGHSKVPNPSKGGSGNSQSNEDMELWQPSKADAEKHGKSKETSKTTSGKPRPDQLPVSGQHRPVLPSAPAHDKGATNMDPKQNESRPRLPLKDEGTVNNEDSGKLGQNPHVQFQGLPSKKQKSDVKNDPEFEGPYLSFFLRNDDNDWRCYPLPLSQNDLKAAAGDFSRKGKTLWRYFDRIDHRQLEMIQTNLTTTPINEEDRTWVIVALQIRPKRARGEDVRTIQVIVRWDWTQWKKSPKKNNLLIPSIPTGIQQPFLGGHTSKTGAASQKRVESFPQSDSQWIQRLELPPHPPTTTSRKDQSVPPDLIQSNPQGKFATGRERLRDSVDALKQPNGSVIDSNMPAMVSGGLPAPPFPPPPTEPLSTKRPQKDKEMRRSRKPAFLDASTEEEDSSGQSQDLSYSDEEEDSSTRPVPGTVRRNPPAQPLPVAEKSSKRTPWRSDQIIMKKSKRQPTEISVSRRTSPPDVYINADPQNANMPFMNMPSFAPPYLYNPNMMSLQAYQWMAFQQGLQQASYPQTQYFANQMLQPRPRPVEIVQAPIEYPQMETYYEPGPTQHSRSRSGRRPPSANEVNSRMENEMNSRMMREKMERLEKENEEHKMRAKKEMEERKAMKEMKEREEKKAMEVKARKEKEMMEMERRNQKEGKGRARSPEKPTRSTASGLPKVPPKMAEEMRKYTNVDFETDVDLSEYSDGGPGPPVPPPPPRRKTRRSSDSDRNGDISGNGMDSDF